MTDVIAEFSVSHPDFPLIETIESHPELAIRTQFQPGTDVDPPVKYYSIEAPDFESVDDALAADSTVDEARVIDETGHQRTYRIRHADGTKILSPGIIESGLRVENLDLSGSAWEFRVFAPDYATMSCGLAHCRGESETFTLERLYSTHDVASDRRVDLSERELETILLAKEEGYFDVPRRTSQTALADQLGVSASTVSERVRKATRLLVESVLEDE